MSEPAKTQRSPRPSHVELLAMGPETPSHPATHLPTATRMRAWILLAGIACVATTPAAATESLPTCLTRQGDETIEAAIIRGSVGPQELLARLAFAEGRSTGFAEDPLVYAGIAWGVMNRVRLAEASPQMRQRYGLGITGVIFRRGQFNPAISTRSPFSKDLLCPQDLTRWRLAKAAATRAIGGGDANPLIQTPWEHTHGLSLVVNFYYPGSTQAKGPRAPWEGSPGLTFIGAVEIGGQVLLPQRIRFYRLSQPPADLSTPSPAAPPRP